MGPSQSPCLAIISIKRQLKEDSPPPPQQPSVPPPPRPKKHSPPTPPSPPSEPVPYADNSATAPPVHEYSHSRRTPARARGTPAKRTPRRAVRPDTGGTPIATGGTAGSAIRGRRRGRRRRRGGRRSSRATIPRGICPGAVPGRSGWIRLWFVVSRILLFSFVRWWRRRLPCHRRRRDGVSSQRHRPCDRRDPSPRPRKTRRKTARPSRSTADWRSPSPSRRSPHATPRPSADSSSWISPPSPRRSWIAYRISFPRGMRFAFAGGPSPYGPLRTIDVRIPHRKRRRHHGRCHHPPSTLPHRSPILLPRALTPTAAPKPTSSNPKSFARTSAASRAPPTAPPRAPRSPPECRRGGPRTAAVPASAGPAASPPRPGRRAISPPRPARRPPPPPPQR
mmetsp:Transcript_28171/g.47857  ORF Transcript_28171/g.47857 Transcript_28171/m.47857 type:complete len:394 (-) Transcript_28171:39-1220(-)